MPADRSRLLVLEDDQAQPWLPSGPLIPEQSSFSRLISQTNPLTLRDLVPWRSRTVAVLSDQAASEAQEPSYASMVASITLYAVFVSFTLASYLDDAWQETILQITVGSYDPVEFILQHQSLTSILQESDDFLAMLFIWLAYFIIPSLFLVLTPLWSVHDMTSVLGALPVSRARAQTEACAKMALLLIWMQAVRNVALSGVTIQTSSAALLIRNSSLNGWTTFCVAVPSLLATLTLLRWNQVVRGDFRDALQHTAVGNHSGQYRPVVQWNAQDVPPGSKAPGAASDDQDTSAILWEDHVPMTVLEEGAAEAPQYPLMRVDSSDSSSPDQVPAEVEARPVVSFCQRVCIFQLALLSTVLWIPTMYIEIFTVQYHGIAAVFLPEPQKNVFVWTLASPFQELHNDNRFFNTILLFLVGSSLLIVIPAACTILGMTVWLGEGRWSANSRRILYALQPTLASGLVVIPATLFSLRNLGIGDSSQVCQWLLLETECVSLSGRPEVGLWLYAIHLITVALFTRCTLKWNSM